jgi:hypothetical protein
MRRNRTRNALRVDSDSVSSTMVKCSGPSHKRPSRNRGEATSPLWTLLPPVDSSDPSSSSQVVRELPRAIASCAREICSLPAEQPSHDAEGSEHHCRSNFTAQLLSTTRGRSGSLAPSPERVESVRASGEAAHPPADDPSSIDGVCSDKISGSALECRANANVDLFVTLRGEEGRGAGRLVISRLCCRNQQTPAGSCGGGRCGMHVHCGRALRRVGGSRPCHGEGSGRGRTMVSSFSTLQMQLSF